VEAAKSNKRASEEYQKAKIYLKQDKEADPEAVKSLDLLEDTYKRKAKMLEIREQNGVRQIR